MNIQVDLDRAECLFEAAQESFFQERFHTAVTEAERAFQILESHVPQIVEEPRKDQNIANVENSVVMISYRPEPDAFALLEKLSPFFERSDVELIFIDNGQNNIGDQVRGIVPTVRFVAMPFNTGCPGGRNLGAALSKGDSLAFVDDDGFTTPDDLERLFTSLRRFEATAVRGRVRSKTDGGQVGSHYDLGPQLCIAPPTTEGISAWRRADFRGFGGFSPLLAGHEGLELCARMLRFCGAHSFLYIPDVVLKHDFTSSQEATTQKTGKQKFNEKFLNFKGVKREDMRAVFKVSASNRALWRNLHSPFIRPVTRSSPATRSISVLTTFRNGREYIDDFVTGLKRQSRQDFELVAVDDGSEDGSSGLLKTLWPTDRLRILSSEGRGRSAALNEGLRACQGEIVVIHDVDDISVSQRIAWTERALVDDKVDMCGFSYFGEPFGPSPIFPDAVGEQDLIARAFFGMPTAFPTFAFRRNRLLQKFNENISAAVDFDWLVRNIIADPSLMGVHIPLPVVYYRQHPRSISSTRTGLQLQTKLDAMACLYSSIPGVNSVTAEHLAKDISNRELDKAGCDAFEGLIDQLCAVDFRLAMKVAALWRIHGLANRSVVTHGQYLHERLRNIMPKNARNYSYWFDGKGRRRRFDRVLRRLRSNRFVS